MKRPLLFTNHICFTVFVLFFSTSALAQLSGTKTIPGDYATISAAVTALNTSGVGTGGVTFNVAANYTETINATISLTATGTSSNPIIFQKDPSTTGSNPVITAYTGGTATPASAVQDGIWRLSGSDYVTIEGIDVKDNPLNILNPATMEYGYALYKASTSNGCQFVTIKNCVITLSTLNNATGTAPMVDGSAGIIVMNATATAAVTALTPTSGGTNSNNKFYSNTIQNCNIGMALVGYAAASPFTLADTNNDIGGSSVTTGNTIVNFGGAIGATNAAAAIRTQAQYALNVSYNTINNNTGLGINHPTTLRGIYLNTATSASATISYNTVTINGGGTTQNISAIENASGSTAASNTISITNNTITNCTYSTATTGGFYGIYNSATPATLNITSNTVSNNSSAATTTGFFYAIQNSGVASIVNITSNSITGNSTAALTTGIFAGIYNSASVPNLSITSNTLAGNTTSATTGVHYPIYNTGTVTTTININSNNIGTALLPSVTFSASNSGAQIFINSTKGGAAAALSISNNSFYNVAYTTGGTGSNTYISNGGATLTQTINNNTFYNLNVNTTGSIVFISNSVAVAAAGTQNINGNSISGSFTKAAGGTITLFTSSGTSVAGAVINNNNNNFSNITVTGATTIAGWANTDAGSGTKTIQNNTFSNWTGGTGAITAISVNITSINNATTGNAINNISSAGAITAIATAAGNDKIYGNTINTLSSTGASTIIGISISSGTAKNIYRNKIYDLQTNNAGGTVYGISVSGTTSAVVAANIYNNLIGDLKAPVASAADAIRGISLTSTRASSSINVYYNTIYLNATSTGTNFGTSGVYHSGSATSTTATLTLSNNIISNTSTPNGTGFTVAYRRGSTSLSNYSSSSNNNLFFAGASGTTRLIFYDGTNSDQVLSAYKTRVSIADAASVTEDLVSTSKFLSTSGASASFLHLDPAKATQAESGGISITGFTDDFDTDIRQGETGYTGTGSSPDIGADEFSGIELGGLSGTYNVGTGQTFTSLTNAAGLFAAINTLGLAGNITVNVTSDITEDGSNVLYQWTETGIGSYTVTIQPNAAASRTLSGNVLTGLIRFNGADRVTIDGSYGGSGTYLTFRNTNTAGTTGTAFTFIGGATNNTIKYCNVEAYTNATNGVILFSTSTIAGGNSNNQVSNCNINATVNSNTGNLCIYSAGTVGNENSTNTISNNNIFNYRDRALDITATGSKSWTISGNSFYNGDVTASINYAAATTLHTIRVLGGTGYSILNNYIGGNAALASGTNAVYSSTLGILSYQGILLTTSGATPASNIKGNTIGKISVSAVPTSTTAANVFIGIETNGSGINIGGSVAGEGNTIGSNTTNSSIVVTTTTSTATFRSNVRGINCGSSGGVVKGNQVSSIDIRNIGTAPGPTTFFGIYINVASAPTQVSNNIVGSTGVGAATHSIRVLSTSTAAATLLTGISFSGLVTSTVLADGNIVQNVSHQATTASGSLIGISNSATTPAVITISNSIISTNTLNATAGTFYGIYNINVSPTTLTITGNTITGNISTSTGAGLLYGIYNVGAAPTVAINSNTFSNNSTAALTSGLFVGIYNAGTPSSLNINSNTLTGNTTSATTGVYYAIFNAGAVTGTININSNNIGNSGSGAITYSAANSGAQIFINNTAGTSAAALSISNNNFQGITYSVASTGSNTYISNTAATLSQAINSNTFTNLNIGTSGNVTFIANSVIVSATGTQNVNNNAISGTFTKSAGGTVTLATSSASCVSGSVINMNSNNFSNITVSGATTIAGWVNTDAGASTKTIQNNIFSNWTGGTSAVTAMSVNITGTNNSVTGNTISNISSTGSITGIATGAGNDNIYLNTINTLSATAAAAVVTGISVTGGTAKNIYKNKIYDLQSSNATGTVNGILVSGSTIVTVNIYNNLIGDLKTPAGSAADPIRGISVTATATNSSINIYYNSIYINASSSATNFGSSGIFHTVSTTATTAALNLRNNIIINISTPKGTGFTVAYRRSGTALNNYASTSNNNLLYAGTPGTTRLIFYDGTNSDQTIVAFKTRVSTRDAASVTENLTTKFASTTGSSSLFLHLDASQSSLAESGGANITGFTDDYDGQIRAGNPGYSGSSSSPDIGADEIFGIETTPPSISYTVLSNTTSTSNRSVTGIVITDGSGVNVAAGTKPRIYYKRFSDANVWLDNTSNTNGWKFTEATNSSTPFSFTIDYSILYGGSAVTAGVIQYFIVAQDIATVANIGINSGTFNATPTSVALGSTAFPITGTINSYNIPFSGNYNIGTNEVFASFTKGDGLFASINTVGLMGNVTVNITSDLTEDGVNALSQWTESGAGNYTLTIQPDGSTTRNITGNASTGLIRFDGADRVTIDGNSAGSYLNFKNTSTSGTGTAFTFINGASNNTIKYCGLEAYANATNGVVLFGTSSAAAGNNNNLIDHCTINATVNSNTGSVGIYSEGTVGKENSSNTISNNAIYNYKDRGIDITATGSTGWTISTNDLYNGDVTASVNYAASSALNGIKVSGGSGYSILNNSIGGNATGASGTNAVYASTLGEISFKGISLTTTSASPTSEIKGNTIASINVSSIPSSAGAIVFTGIETSGTGINIGGSSAADGNIIGSASSNSSIIITTTTASSSNTSNVSGINCTSANGIINYNQVGGIDVSNIGTVPASSTIQGIYVNNAAAPTQVNNNLIGSTSTSNSIRVLSASASTSNSITGITIGNLVNSTMQVNNNRIENISNLSTTSSGTFTGINNATSLSSANITISTDTIQIINSVSNSNSSSGLYAGIISSSASVISNNIISNITLASTGTNAQVIGINVPAAYANTISGNTISNLSTASNKVISGSAETSSPANATVVGILDAATSGTQNIYNNIISTLGVTGISAINTMVTGIGIAATTSGNIYNNRIGRFTNTATGSEAGICGIMAAAGTFNVYNNSIRVNNLANTNGIKLYGIDHAAGATWNYFHNSVRITGSSNGTATRTAAFIRPVSGDLLLKNNIFLNIRTGTGTHYAISNLVAPPATTWSATASDYNDIYSSNANTAGEWGNGVNTTFSQWKTFSGGDAHSVNATVSIVTSTIDLEPDAFTNCFLNNAGTPITSPITINTDINNVSRSATVPDIGAYEFAYTVFTVSAANNSPVCSGSTVDLTSDPGTAVTPSYSWKNPSNVIVATTQNPSVTSAAGVFTVTVTDINGCFASATTTVSLNQRPTASLTGAAAICEGNSTNLTLTATGSGTLTGTLNDGTAFSGTAPTIIVPVSPIITTPFYIVDLDDASCSAIRADMPDTVTIIVTHPGDWLGTNSSNWNDASNWCGGVPVSTTGVNIPGGLAFYPVLSSGTASIDDIDIQTGGSLTVTGATLQIGGTIHNSGIFTATNGTIALNGTIAQTIPASLFASNTIKSLTVNNNAGVTLLGTLNLTGILTISNGSLSTGGYLTLKSSATATASVANITSNASTPVNGNVTVERYIPGRRKYRIITSSVTTSASNSLSAGQENLSIWGSWQNSANNSTANIGTFITGGSSADGYDQQTVNASMYTYDDVNRRYNAFSTANGKNTKYTPLKAGVPYYLFVYGDRTNSVSTSTPNNTILKATGTLLTGTQTYNTSSTIPLSNVVGRYTMLGNPFASPIDWTTLPRTNLDNTYWGWDPNLSSTGGYVTVSTSGTTTLISPYSGTTGLNQYIQPGQGFFVRTSGASPVLTIREQDKVSNFNGNAFRGAGTNNVSLIAVNLLYENAGNKVLADGALAAFDTSYSNATGKEDGLKINNTTESIALLNGSDLLSINARKMPQVNDTLFLNIARLTKAQYTMQIFTNQMDSSKVQPYLEDNYLHTITPISLADTTLLTININSTAASFDANRFRIIFRERTIPAAFVTLKAKQADKTISVDWDVTTDSAVQKYEVERSADDVSYSKIAEVIAIGNNSFHSYHFTDASPFAGNNYYHIKALHATGLFFSNTVLVKLGDIKPSIKIYPNPVKNISINIQLTGIEKGEYSLRLLNVHGQKLYSQQVFHQGGIISVTIPVIKKLPYGVYYVELSNGTSNYTEAILITQ